MLRLIGSCCLLWLIISLQLIAQTSQIHFLSGTDRDNPSQWDFLIDKGRKSGSWQKINVPSCWETEGFGEYSFGTVPSDEKAIYKHQFIALPTWQGKHINLVFEGVLTDAQIRLNGTIIGTHQGGYERFSFDVSTLLKLGITNELEVTVNKRSTSTAITQENNQISMWTFGGIYKPVYLEILPSVHITGMSIETQANGYLTAQIYINKNESVQIATYLQDLAGKTAGNLLQNNIKQLSVGNATGFELSATFSGVQAWSAEFPQRYRLVVELQDLQGKVLHRISQLIGFRTSIVKNDGLYINDKKTKLRGVKHRALWHESGASVSRLISELDGLLLKELNANAIYNPLYQPDDHMLDVCDSLGLYVIYTVAEGSAPAATIQRDLNHPSVILLAADSRSKSPVNRPVIHTVDLTELQVNAVNEAVFTQAWQAVNNGKQVGLFLSSFADELVKEAGKPVEEPSAANRGIVNAYRNPKPVFHAIRELWSPLQLSSESPDGYFQGILTAHNKFIFTNLNRCKFIWQLVDVANPLEGASSQQIIASGMALPPNIAPGFKDKLLLNIPADWQERDLLIITAFSPVGSEIYTWHFPITTQERHIPQLLLGEFAETTAPRKTNEGWELSGGDITVRIHSSGHLSAITQQNKLLKINGLPLKEPSANSGEIQQGSLVFRFPDTSPVQRISYALSDAGVLRIQYTGKEIAFSCTEILQEVSTFAAGPLPQGQTKGIQTGLHQQKPPLHEGDYRQFYWAKLRTIAAPINIMTASANVTMRLLSDGQILFTNTNTASGKGSAATTTLFLKVGE
jgi:hypothetical protein